MNMLRQNMKLFKEILIQESQNNAQREIDYAIESINNVYKEWKKTSRRINAVDIITTSANKLNKLHASVIDYIHDTAKLKLAIILMRIMDLPPWKSVESKKTLYKKLFPLISKMQGFDPNTGSGGNLREIIMTRLSAAICQESKNEDKVFVAYEPIMSESYLRYIFGNETPAKIYKMQALSLPEDFGTLIETLKINQEKAELKFNSK